MFLGGGDRRPILGAIPVREEDMVGQLRIEHRGGEGTVAEQDGAVGVMCGEIPSDLLGSERGAGGPVLQRIVQHIGKRTKRIPDRIPPQASDQDCERHRTHHPRSTHHPSTVGDYEAEEERDGWHHFQSIADVEPGSGSVHRQLWRPHDRDPAL